MLITSFPPLSAQIKHRTFSTDECKVIIMIFFLNYVVNQSILASVSSTSQIKLLNQVLIKLFNQKVSYLTCISKLESLNNVQTLTCVSIFTW